MYSNKERMEKMKKIYGIAIVFGILVCISNFVLAAQDWNKENKKREKAFQSALSSYMQTFMTEETPEEDRIVNYQFTGYSNSEEEIESKDGKLTATISFQVTPVNQENTTWMKHGDYCFAVFSKVNGEYVLDRISRYPDHYDEFLKRFEEYKTNQEVSKTVAIQGEKQDNLVKQEIQKVSNLLMVGCVMLFVVSSAGLLVCLIKKKSR